MRLAWIGSIGAHAALAGGLLWVVMDRPPVVETGPVGAVTVALVDAPAEPPAVRTPALPAPAMAAPRAAPKRVAAVRPDVAPLLPAPAETMARAAQSAHTDPLPEPSSVPAPAGPEREPTVAPMETTSTGSPDDPQTRGTGKMSSDPWPAYFAAVREAVERAKHYPFSARLAGLEDRVAVNFLIDADGAAEQIRLTEPSRFPVLNDAALDTIRRVARFPAPPLRDRQSGVRVTVPLEFALRVHKENPPE